MEERKKIDVEALGLAEQEEKSTFDFQTIFKMLVLNWKWFLLSIIVCVGIAYTYLQYATPVYNAHAKLLIKEEQSNNSRNMMAAMSDLGTITNSAGIDNEIEILYSITLAQQAITDLKLYTTYRLDMGMKKPLLYKTKSI